MDRSVPPLRLCATAAPFDTSASAPGKFGLWWRSVYVEVLRAPREVELVAADKAQGEEGWNFECGCEGKIALAPDSRRTYIPISKAVRALPGGGGDSLGRSALTLPARRQPG
jgi:hypothetical protein